MDAVLVGYKEDKFNLIAKKKVNFNDVKQEYDWDKNFLRNN